MTAYPIRQAPGRRTWEVLDDLLRYAVVEFPDGRIACLTHGEECSHVFACIGIVELRPRLVDLMAGDPDFEAAAGGEPWPQRA